MRSWGRARTRGNDMAAREKLYDNPRSKKKDETQEAKKGDVKEIDGEEYESVKAHPKNRPNPPTVYEPRPEKGTSEIWRRKKSTPTS